MDIREQFEKLPEIKGTIFEYKHEVIFDESENKYTTPCYSTFEPEYVYFLNGAWYAFQEQQAKINAVLQYLDTGDHPLDFSANTIRELLKWPPPK